MKDLFDKINVVDALVVVFSGIAMIAAVLTDQKDVALAAGSGLIGYLGHGIASK